MKKNKGQQAFQFKQFGVKQDRCAMKVCTDACILGAYTATQNPRRILDIGAGTGLLGLMLAQRYPLAVIEAVEIDQEAVVQCHENFSLSPWHQRLSIWEGRIQDFSPEQQYDLIISNPPFYPEHLASPNRARTVAMHTETLSFYDLAKSISRLLHVNGCCSLLLPPMQMRQFQQIACKEGLYCHEEMLVCDNPSQQPIRIIALYAKQEPSLIKTHTFYVKSSTGEYSQEFTQLLRDYYIIF